MVKKEKRSIFYILTKVGNGGFKRSLLRLRALRVADRFPNSGGDCVMRSWRKSLAFLTQCLSTHPVSSEVGDHVCFGLDVIDDRSTGAQSKAGVEELARLALQS